MDLAPARADAAGRRPPDTNLIVLTVCDAGGAIRPALLFFGSLNSLGINSKDAFSIVSVKSSTVTNNTTGLQRTTGGQIVSHGGNSVVYNTTNGTFSP